MVIYLKFVNSNPVKDANRRRQGALGLLRELPPQAIGSLGPIGIGKSLQGPRKSLKESPFGLFVDFSLDLQTARSRSYLCTLGPKVVDVYVLGALGLGSLCYLDPKKEVKQQPKASKNGPKGCYFTYFWGPGTYEGTTAMIIYILGALGIGPLWYLHLREVLG